jgi:hypothetical protein
VVLRHPARSTDPTALIAGTLATGAMGIQNAAGAAGYALAGFAALLVPSSLCVVLAARWKTH